MHALAWYSLRLWTAQIKTAYKENLVSRGFVVGDTWIEHVTPAV
jgi:hypothetical protein